MKKASLMIAVSLFISINCVAQNKVTVTVNNLKDDSGVCFFCLYNKAEGFPADMQTAVSCQRAPIKNGKATYTFANLATGNYAVGAFHDEDNSGKLNTNFIGIPKEGVGVSKNMLRSMGPPKFEDAKFSVEPTSNLSFDIKLKY